jgi:GH25 family lysozyme M1 (1,4-beta-N-acetylmuramidase)
MLPATGSADPRSGDTRVRRILPSFLALLLLAVGLTATSTTAEATGPGGLLSGPDVASYQHPNGAAIDWTAVRRDGHGWAFVKATEGTTYLNPGFSGDWRDTAAAGLYRGAYHYARPSATAGSARAQASAFADAIGPQRIPGTLPPILDLEEAGGLSPAALASWVSEFLTSTQAFTGRVPMIYTYPNFWKNSMASSRAFTGYPLWIASYGVSSPALLGWSNYTFWQYTSTGSVKGIATPGATDISVFNGTALDLAALALTGTWRAPASTAADGGNNPDLSTVSAPSRYVPVTPRRFVDTRTGLGAPRGPVPGEVTVTVPDTVPADATGVVLDVSAVDPRGAGWLRLAAAGTAPRTTALNYPAQHSVTGLAVTQTDSSRQVTVSTSGGATDLAVDLVGYYTASEGTGGHWSPLPPQRVVDTRSGVGVRKGRAKGEITFTLPGSVPPDATGVVLDVTAVDATGDGYLRLAAAGTPPTTTALNYEGGGSTTGLAITGSTGGQVTVSLAGSPTDLVVDLVGYYEGAATDGSAYVGVSPQRFLDTRSGLGASGPGTGPLSVTVPAVVPRDATAVILDVSVVDPKGKGYVRLAAPGTEAVTTAVNIVPGRSRTGLVVTGIRDGQITLAVFGAKTHLVVDLVGYQTSVTATPPSPSASDPPGPSPTP